MIRKQDRGRLYDFRGFVVSRSDPDLGSFAWAFTRPFRFYLRRSPLKRGKGILRRLVMHACMSREQKLDVTLPCGADLCLTTSEVIGQHLAIFGTFEEAELRACSELVTPGSCAIDVGANVGIFSLTMAVAAGPQGSVIAFEPLNYNLVRLQEHIEHNGLSNIQPLRFAAGASSGTAALNPGFDPAYAFLKPETDNPDAESQIVEVITVDEAWARAGRPQVSFIKIDVEGNEPSVIHGACEMLAENRPSVLVEAPTLELLERVSTSLERFGLKLTQPNGFERWNYLFLA